MKRWVTEVTAIDPANIERGIIRWAGPEVPGETVEEAERYCQENGLGYCRVLGQLIEEIPLVMAPHADKFGERDRLMTKEFEIWCEGYRATGERGVAHLVGKSSAETFEEALEKHMIEHPRSGIEKYQSNVVNDGEVLVNEKMRKMMEPHYHIWGCRLFDNETDARKSFG